MIRLGETKVDFFQHCRYSYIYIYIYIYIYSLKKKPKTGYFRITNLFPSCFSFLV